MEQLLQPVDTTSSLFIYRNDQKFICTDYNKLSDMLAESLFESNQDHQLMVDWIHTPTHPLSFEILLQKSTGKNTYEFLMRFFDFVFLKNLQKYLSLPEVTILLAMRRNQTSGLQIHVVGVEVAHDDYIHLCDWMQDACLYQEGDLSVYLTIPSNFPLPSCDRPNGTGDLYMPVRLIHVQFEWNQEHGVWHSHSLVNITKEQQDTDSFFSKMANHPSRWKAMVRGMMPIPQPNATYVHFPTEILTKGFRRRQAVIKSYLNNENYMVEKEKVLIEGKPFFYDFLKSNSTHIDLILLTNNLALKTWYARFQQTDSTLDHFRNLDLKLRRLCPHLKDEPSPLVAVLKAHERPVYYAILNLLHGKSDLNKIHEQFPFLSQDLPRVPPQEAIHLTFNTILHCAYLTGEGSFVSHMGAGYDWIASTITSLSELKQHVLWVQKRIYPVVKSPEKVYSWNMNIQKWVALAEPVFNIQDALRWSMEVLNTYSELSPELMKNFQEEGIQTVTREVLSNAPGINIGQTMTEAPEVYGTHVPEYYFFDSVA